MVIPQRPPTSLPPPAAAFERLLARSAKGNALWRPAAHTGSGSVGDCGFFRDGSFVKLFSAFGPPMGLPMLQLDNGDVQRHNVPNSSVIQSSARSKVVLARGVPVGPPPHTCTGTFELAADDEAIAFLAFGGHSRVIDTGPARKLAQWLVENRQAIYFRYQRDYEDLKEDEIVLLHETTKAGAWLGGVAYPTGAVSGSFTLDGNGARVSVRRPRDPTAQKHPASVRWEFTYGRSDGPTPSCCVLAKPVIARRRTAAHSVPISASLSTSTMQSTGHLRSRSSVSSTRSAPTSTTRSRSSTWSSDTGPRSHRTSATSLSSNGRASSLSRSSVASGGSAASGPPTGRRLSVRALTEWNRLHPSTPMTEEHLAIRSPKPLETIPPSPLDSADVGKADILGDQQTNSELPADIPADESEPPESLSLLDRLLDNILREYPGIEIAVGDWNCISDYEERCGRSPSPELVVSFKALQKWVTRDGSHAVYISHIPPQATSLGFIDLRAYTTTIRAPPATYPLTTASTHPATPSRPPVLPSLVSLCQSPLKDQPCAPFIPGSLTSTTPTTPNSARSSMAASSGRVRLGLGAPPMSPPSSRTPSRKASLDVLPAVHTRRPSGSMSSASSQTTTPSSGLATPMSGFGITSTHRGPPVGTGAGRRLRAGSVLVAMSVPAPPRRAGSVPNLRI